MNKKLKIDMTEQDCQDLMNGEEFNWTFTTECGEDIDIHLFNTDTEDDDE